MYLLFFEVDFKNTQRYRCLAYMGHQIKFSGALKEQNQGETPPSLSSKGLPQRNSFLLLHLVRWALIPLDSFGRYLTDDWWSGQEESLHQVKTSGLGEAEIEGPSKSHFYRLHGPLRPENIALQDSFCICFKTRWAPLHIWTLRTLTDIKPFNIFQNIDF